VTFAGSGDGLLPALRAASPRPVSPRPATPRWRFSALFAARFSPRKRFAGAALGAPLRQAAGRRVA